MDYSLQATLLAVGHTGGATALECLPGGLRGYRLSSIVYPDSFYFARQFKKLRGVTPFGYRGQRKG